MSPWRPGPGSSTDLKARGLDRVYLVTGDAHPGVRHAIGEVLPNASWQHCRTHFAKNLSSMVATSQWPTSSAMFHTIVHQPDAESVWSQAREVVGFCRQKFPHVAGYLEEALDELSAFTAVPKAVWTRVWSENHADRLNREIRRRTDVLGSSRTGLRWCVWSRWWWPISMMIGSKQKRYMSLTGVGQPRKMMTDSIIDADESGRQVV